MIGWAVVIAWVIYGAIFFVGGGLWIIGLVRRGRIVVLPD